MIMNQSHFPNPNRLSKNWNPKTLAGNPKNFTGNPKNRRWPTKNSKKTVRFAPFAPRNTSSFIIRSKKSGGLAPAAASSPATPAVLPTPRFSPHREEFADVAREAWGVNGYGSMKGIIRVRANRGCENLSKDSKNSSNNNIEHEMKCGVDVSRFEMVYSGCENFSNNSSYVENDVMKCGVDVSRFEMVYPVDGKRVLGNRVDEQGELIGRLEEESVCLKGRVGSMEKEMGELRRRLRLLESRHCDRNDENDDNCGENCDRASGHCDTEGENNDNCGENGDRASGHCDREGENDENCGENGYRASGSEGGECEVALVPVPMESS